MPTQLLRRQLVQRTLAEQLVSIESVLLARAAADGWRR